MEKDIICNKKVEISLPKFVYDDLNNFQIEKRLTNIVNAITFLLAYYKQTRGKNWNK